MSDEKQNSESNAEYLKERLKSIEKLLQELYKRNLSEAECKLYEHKWGAHEIENDSALMSIIICPEFINENLIDFTERFQKEVYSECQSPQAEWSYFRTGLDYYVLTNVPEKIGEFPRRRLLFTSCGLIEFNEKIIFDLSSNEKTRKFISLDRIEYILPYVVASMTNMFLKTKLSGSNKVYFVFTLHNIKGLPLFSRPRMLFLDDLKNKYIDNDTLTIKIFEDINKINQDIKGFCEQILIKTCRAFNLPTAGRWQWIKS